MFIFREKEDKELKVKVADFHRNRGDRMLRSDSKMPTLPWRTVLKWTKVANQSRAEKRDTQRSNDKISYADAVKTGEVPISEFSSVRGACFGNGWLHRSAVASLCDHRTSEFLIDSSEFVTVRRMGNKQALLTFQTVALMKQFIADHSKSGNQWFTSISPWSVESSCSFGREVWLSCYGNLIHAWNSSTFTAIGQYWGEVIQLEEDTVKSIRFDVGKVKDLTKNPDVINHHMKLVVGFKSFVI
ncbi:hypothetical protein Dimus_019043 [Dionaea muscipula]